MSEVKDNNYPEYILVSEYVIPYLRKLGYQFIKPEVNIPDHRRMMRADLVVYLDEQKKTPYIVGEVKRRLGTDVTLLDPSVQQVFSYAAALGKTVHYVFVTDGRNYHWFERNQEGQSLTPLANPPEFFWRSDQVLEPLIPVTDQLQLANLLWNIVDHLRATATVSVKQIGIDLMHILVAKLHDEKMMKKGEPSRFSFTEHQVESAVVAIEQLYKDAILQFEDITRAEKIDWALPSQSLFDAAKIIEPYALSGVLASAPSDFFSKAFVTVDKGSASGHFYTPSPVTKLLIELAHPAPGDRVIDPACGVAGILVEGSRYLAAQASEDGDQKTIQIAYENILGIEFNPGIAKIAANNLAANGVSPGKVSAADALHIQSYENLGIEFGTYDVVVLDPPIGIQVTDTHIIQQFELTQTRQIVESETLFIALSIKLLKSGGRLAIVVPENFLTSPSLLYARKWLLEETIIRAIISLPAETYVPITTAKFSVLLIEKKSGAKGYRNTLVSIVSALGYDRRGHQIRQNNLPELLSLIREFLSTGMIEEFLREDGLSVWSVASGDLQAERLSAAELAPRYSEHLEIIKRSAYPVAKLGDIASTITGLQTKPSANPENKGVILIRPRAIQEFQIDLADMPSLSIEQSPRLARARVKIDDIIIITRGTSLGRAAVVEQLPMPAVVDSSVTILRILSKDKVDPFFLALVINSSIGKTQIEHLQASGTAFPSVHWSDLGKLVIPLPPLSKQQKIASCAREKFEKVRSLVKRAEELNSSTQNFILSELLGEARQ